MKIPATLLSSLAKVECLKEGGFVGALDPGYVAVRAFGVSRLESREKRASHDDKANVPSLFLPPSLPRPAFLRSFYPPPPLRDNRLPFLPIRHSSRFLMEARTADMEGGREGGRGKAESLNVIFSVIDSCDEFPQEFRYRNSLCKWRCNRRGRGLLTVNRSRLIFSCPSPSLPWEVPFSLRACPATLSFPCSIDLDYRLELWSLRGREREGRGRTTPPCKRKRVEAVHGIVSDFSSGPKQ